MPRLTTLDLAHRRPFGPALMIAILLSACAAGASPSTPTPSEATESDSPGSLPSLSPAVGCLDSPPDVEGLAEVLSAQTDPVACFGSDPLTFDAQLTGAGVVDCPIVVEPRWLSCPSGLNLQLVGETRKVGAPFLIVALDPASPVEIGNLTDARVTGHYDDPVAQMCHETERAPAFGTPQPVAEAIAQCRRTFVVTDAVPLEG